jgi:hypothetical protein
MAKGPAKCGLACVDTIFLPHPGSGITNPQSTTQAVYLLHSTETPKEIGLKGEEVKIRIQTNPYFQVWLYPLQALSKLLP